VAEVFVEVADTLVDDFDVLDMLQLLVDRSVELFETPAVGIMLTEGGDELRVVASSDEGAELLELFQLQNDEGPCLDCFRTGLPVLVPRLDTQETPWPRFTAAALAAGFATVVASPMRLRGQVVGTLNLFGTRDSPALGDVERSVAQSLADAATIAILQDRLGRHRDVVNQQMQAALNGRVALEQAKGVLSALLDISPAEAFEQLRSYARSNRRPLTDVAEEVASGQWSAFVSGEA
jgi:GAF domain-containing protein